MYIKKHHIFGNKEERMRHISSPLRAILFFLLRCGGIMGIGKKTDSFFLIYNFQNILYILEIESII